MLFGDEFDFDERAEVGGGLRGVEGDNAFGVTGRDGFAVERRKDYFKERRRADGVIHLSKEQCHFVRVGHTA